MGTFFQDENYDQVARIYVTVQIAKMDIIIGWTDQI
jgi:hypothetical protein